MRISKTFHLKYRSLMRLKVVIEAESLPEFTNENSIESKLSFQNTRSLNQPFRNMLNLKIEVGDWIKRFGIVKIYSIQFHGSSFLGFFLVKDLLFRGIPVEESSVFHEKKLTKSARFVFIKFEEFVIEALSLNFSQFPSTFAFCSLCKNSLHEFEVSYESVLSVVIPTKNVDVVDLLCLVETVSNQIRESDEIIIVDDNETACLELRDFNHIHSNILVVKGNQSGIGSARNVGIKASRGEIISFVDSDDKLSNNFIKIQRKIISRHSNIAATGTWLQAFGQHSRIYPQWDNFNPLGMLICLPPAGVLMWKRQALDLLGGFNEDFTEGFEDFDLLARANLMNLVVVVIDSIEYQYRRGHGSLSQSWNVEKEKSLLNRVLINSKALCDHKYLELLEILEDLGKKISYSSIDQLYNKVSKEKLSILRLKKYRNNYFVLKVWNRTPIIIKDKMFNFLTR